MVLERTEEQREEIERWLDTRSDHEWKGLGLTWEQCPAEEVSERKHLTAEPLVTLLRTGQRDLRREKLDVAVWAKVEIDSVIHVDEEWLRPETLRFVLPVVELAAPVNLDRRVVAYWTQSLPKV